jgi:hypothetical protein|tara:strand:- start:216 stop:380 length:165 start_codon:yes stop_codon:yes gene_type:complete
MDKYYSTKLVKETYKRLILKYHKQGKDSTSLMRRLKEIALKEVRIKTNSSKNKD